ncbi:MAG TPA: hypothetical protein VFK37_01345 [Bacillales bacterium]|nr:hypothetical protein [Bacillales bacterium]
MKMHSLPAVPSAGFLLLFPKAAVVALPEALFWAIGQIIVCYYGQILFSIGQIMFNFGSIEQVAALE